MKAIDKAKVLFVQMLENNDECTSTEMMVEFSKQENNALIKQNKYLKEVLNNLFDVDDIGGSIIEVKKYIRWVLSSELLNKNH